MVCERQVQAHKVSLISNGEPLRAVKLLGVIFSYSLRELSNQRNSAAGSRPAAACLLCGVSDMVLS